MVAVESMPGHDIGRVTLTGRLVALQMKKARIKPDSPDIKRVFRKARPVDLEKYREAQAREHDTMIRARRIAEELHLNMKIGDVEYQGDGNKAIFYYIAEERVDFRQLIKVLAETFKVRIEMKQIGARQEAGRIGGIGPCGRPLCCASWMTNFVSVGTAAARCQDLSLNPQKLAGQCAKLKCCLNFEVDTYMESTKELPPKDIRLETADSTYYHFKTDIFKKEITYSTDKNLAANLVTIDAARAFEVIEMNKAGEKPLKLELESDKKQRRKCSILPLRNRLPVSTRARKRKRRKNRLTRVPDLTTRLPSLRASPKPRLRTSLRAATRSRDSVRAAARKDRTRRAGDALTLLKLRPLRSRWTMLNVRYSIPAAVVAMVMSAVAGCTSPGDFSHYTEVPPEGWAYGNALDFDTGREDSLSRGDLEVSLRHNIDYPYSNLWLEICYNNNGRQTVDTVNIPLADVHGRWYGRGFGASRQAEAVVATDVSPLSGAPVKVRHIMRVDTLRGVEAVGVYFRSR